jgi:hypothetical protein
VVLHRVYGLGQPPDVSVHLIGRSAAESQEQALAPGWCAVVKGQRRHADTAGGGYACMNPVLGQLPVQLATKPVDSVERGGILCRSMLDSRLLVGIVSPNSVKSSLLRPAWATGLCMGAVPRAGVEATLNARQGTRTAVSCSRRARLSQSQASQ